MNRKYPFRIYWPPSKRAWMNLRFRIGYWIGGFTQAKR